MKKSRAGHEKDTFTRKAMMKVPFIDLEKQHSLLAKPISSALSRLGRKGDFILGEDVKSFEAGFAAYCGTPHAVGLNSGTDALFLCLKALGIGAGDEVIVPAFTFIATAFCVSYCGATPVFCDVDPKTYCLDPLGMEKAITRRTRAVIPVHLFGQCCDMGPLMKIARGHGISVIEDACQAHGAEYRSKKAGSIGDAGCFSFYPTKNLGGWGDGGMAVTSNRALADRIRLLRDCGRGKTRYEHVTVGYNSRLDSAQAAVLSVKLKRLDSWNRSRQKAAALYDRHLSGLKEIKTPVTAGYGRHVFHVYAIRARDRGGLADFLRSKGVGTAVNYPLPLHLQPAYSGGKSPKGSMPVSEAACSEILSLPMHPFIKPAQVSYVCRQIRLFYGRPA